LGGASKNNFIRFHFTGSLELSLMALDLYDDTQSEADLQAYLPLVSAVVEGFRQRFPNRDANGKVDFWPAQALETWECKNWTGGMENGARVGAPTRASCVTNPSTDIAGLMAVLPRLLALPNDTTTATQRSGWAVHLAALPPLPMAKAGQCFLPKCECSVSPSGTCTQPNSTTYSATKVRISTASRHWIGSAYPPSSTYMLTR
jgi:alpha-L-fucosidase 2